MPKWPLRQATGAAGGQAIRVAPKAAESAEITSFYLDPQDGGALASFAPGQFIGLRLLVNSQEIRRNYSLSATPNGRDYRISVEHEAGGIVSNYLHDAVHEGDLLELSPPASDFVLADGDKPVVLISGDVGITPPLAMLDAALAGQRSVHFIHFARNRNAHVFREAIEARNTRHAQLTAWLTASRDVDAYFLGPSPSCARSSSSSSSASWTSPKPRPASISLDRLARWSDRPAQKLLHD
jgi:nitric oxide dioxygenase